MHIIAGIIFLIIIYSILAFGYGVLYPFASTFEWFNTPKSGLVGMILLYAIVCLSLWTVVDVLDIQNQYDSIENTKEVVADCRKNIDLYGGKLDFLNKISDCSKYENAIRQDYYVIAVKCFILIVFLTIEIIMFRLNYLFKHRKKETIKYIAQNSHSLRIKIIRKFL